MSGWDGNFSFYVGSMDPINEIEAEACIKKPKLYTQPDKPFKPTKNTIIHTPAFRNRIA
jgi:hypothetical protein